MKSCLRFVKPRCALVLLGVLGFTPVAEAAGWDTPIVYTARHQGMGGTAIASVDDPSASYHNPAGYQGVKGIELLGNFTLLLGNLQTSPDFDGQDAGSNTIVAPFPMLSAGFRVHEWITIGLGAYPVASGAAEYDFSSDAGEVNDGLRTVFFEFSPAISLNIPERIVPGHLSIGVGYRMTYVTFDRYQTVGDAQILDIKTGGMNFGGVRVGLQYEPIPGLRLGAVFRNRVIVDTTGDTAIAQGFDAIDTSFDFTLPLQVGGGVRYDLDRYGFAVDYQFTDQSQNDSATLAGTLLSTTGEGLPLEVENVYEWKNGNTVRVGGEYRIPVQKDEVPIRVGYVWDGRVGNPLYPTAFGTPPTATNSFTLGAGFVRQSWQINLATAYRFGSTSVPNRSEAPADLRSCLFCSYGGEYKIGLTGLYVDFSYAWE
ncbi:MAG: hypothetical protein MK135_07940 [Polyangiaceae bacterium]|nr:hypothetical protein [Polyangiaceae bacterium]